jgi:hypothetical protein
MPIVDGDHGDDSILLADLLKFQKQQKARDGLSVVPSGPNEE